MPTGVDRVEFAYLRALLADPAPLFGLARTSLGFVLLDRAGAQAVLGAVTSGDWGHPGWLSRLSRRLTPPQQAAQTLLRRHSIARCLPRLLPAMLRRHCPAGLTYLNTGHSNLTPSVFSAMRGHPGGRIVALVHDTIPLDHPDFQRPGTVDLFAAKMRRVAANADLVLTTSQVAKGDIARHFQTFGRVPPIVIAPLGVDPAIPDPTALPADIDLTGPYFVTVGTIEPRKNHALLLDVWSDLGPTAPRLFICGSRGWRNQEVFARLDAGVPGVRELPGLSDAAVAALLQGSRGLLFPSLAEGYGLPPVEAAQMRVPVVCCDLAIMREVLGSVAIYLDPHDPYVWKETVNRLATAATPTPAAHFVPPNWDEHFKIVLSMA